MKIAPSRGLEALAIKGAFCSELPRPGHGVVVYVT